MRTIDENMHRLPCLIVHIETTACHHLLDGSILDAATSIVTSIADLQRLILVVRFLVKELCLEEIFHVVGLCGLQLERFWIGCTSPSTTDGEIALLRDKILIVIRDEFKRDWSVPIHVPVTVACLSITRASVRAFLEHAILTGVEIVRFRHQRDNGEGVGAVIFDERTCHHL